MSEELSSTTGGFEGRDSEPTVQLLVAGDRDRRLLADRISDDYTVVRTPPEDILETSFDLCIADPPLFEQYHASLDRRKEVVEPVFLPCLFLAEREQFDGLPGRVWDVADEIIAMPLAPAELTHRLENLLERRRLSLDIERERAQVEERFECLFDTAPDPIVVTSADGEISEANEAFASAVGESADSLAGQSITNLGFTPTDPIERVLLRVVEPDENGGQMSGSVSFEFDDTGMVTELNAEVVTALGGASERIGIFRDVTERQQREADLREQNERLEEFAATIAHDIRNPLTVASGRLELARQTTDEEHFDAVSRAHDRMEQLVDEVLTLARQGQVVTDPEPVRLEAVARRAWRNVESADATLSISADGELRADEGRLTECLENLFRNAVEHGGDAVSVRVGRFDAEERDGFYVEDDGPGIPESDRDDVFEAGFTNADDGTGFGLSIVNQIVEGHGWNVSVTDGRCGGARFEIVARNCG